VEAAVTKASLHNVSRNSLPWSLFLFDHPAFTIDITISSITLYETLSKQCD